MSGNTREAGDLPGEVWILVNRRDGNVLPPIDDDGTRVFMAWPSREQAMNGLKHQVKIWLDGEAGDWEPVQLFPGHAGLLEACKRAYRELINCSDGSHIAEIRWAMVAAISKAAGN